MKILKNVLRKFPHLIILSLFSHYLVAAEAPPVIAFAPQNYISDFPNEQLSIQTLKVSMVYDDITIPGNAGMDIVVTRRQGGDKVKFNTTTFTLHTTFASNEPVHNSSCLGDYARLSVIHDSRKLLPAGYDSTTHFPSSTVAMFKGNIAFTCENGESILRFPDGRKYTFTLIDSAQNDYTSTRLYAVSVIEDIFGNTISYEYEDDVVTYLPKRLKKISRNDGQVVNFVYDTTDVSYTAYTPEFLKEITYSGKKVQYIFKKRKLDTFIDAEGRETKYTYSMYSGIGNQIQTITTPEGLAIYYRFSPVVESMTQIPNYGDEGGLYMSLSDGVSGGQLVSKEIYSPGGSNYQFFAYDTASGIGSTNHQRTITHQFNYKGDLDLTTEYVVKSIRGDTSSGQITSIKRFEGEFYRPGAYINQYRDHNLLYEQLFDWEAINTEEYGCFSATRYMSDSYALLDCFRYEKSAYTLNLHNLGGVDSFTKIIRKYNPYGAPETTDESFLTHRKYTNQTYFSDIENWLLNRQLQTSLSSFVGIYNVLSTVTDEFTYYNSYPFNPEYQKRFGVWQKHFKDYHSDGTIKKIEYNEKLKDSNGAPTGSNRYVLFSNYKRGIAQTTTKPHRYNSTDTMSSYKTVSNEGLVTRTVDMEGNGTNYHYDAIGRLSIIDPDDPYWADTVIDWAYDGGVGNNQPKKVTQSCSLNVSKTACQDGSVKLIETSLYDYWLREVQNQKTDVANNKTVYQNNTYNVFDKPLFQSFSSFSDGETNGVNYTYDGLQRVTSQSISHGGTTNTQYPVGNKIRVIDPEQNSTTISYLAYSMPEYKQAISITSPESINTTIKTNVFGNIESIKQSGWHKGNVISQTEYRAYDTQKRVCQIKRNDIGATVLSYNAIGDVVWHAQGITAASNTECTTSIADNKKVNFIYDNLGDQHIVSYGDSTSDVTNILDKNGDITQLITDDVIQNYGYNSLRKLDWENLSIDNITFNLVYGYNSAGSLSSTTYPNADVVTYAPNAFGQATQSYRSQDSYSYASNASYYPAGILDSFTYGNGIIHKTTLNTRNLPQQLNDSIGSTSALDLSYTYDNNLNITSIIDNNNSAFSLTNLTYDSLDRLTGTTGNSGIGSSSMSYDGLGNITSYVSSGRSLTYDYDTANNKLTAVVDSVGDKNRNFTNGYDSRGNVINNGTRMFNYNLANQMVTSENNNYIYDGYNRRVKTEDSQGISYSFYNQSGRLLYMEKNGGGVNYIFLGEKLIAKDGDIPDTNESSLQHYRPFGETLETPKDDVGYTGHKFDKDLGLSYMQARYYDPAIGRFYGNDPVGYTPDNPVMSFNRYSYVNNNPYKYVDPDGRNSDWFGGKNMYCFSCNNNDDDDKDGVTTSNDAVNELIKEVADVHKKGAKKLIPTKGKVIETLETIESASNSGSTGLAALALVAGPAAPELASASATLTVVGFTAGMTADILKTDFSAETPIGITSLIAAKTVEHAVKGRGRIKAAQAEVATKLFLKTSLTESLKEK